VVFDPNKVGYAKLLDVYWRNVDPFDGRGQFCDKGSQYRPEIFVHDAEQRRLAEASKAAVEAEFKRPVAVKVTQAATFYVAEDYHQDYYKKNPVRYKFYRYNCGRDARLEQVWGKSETPSPTN
jgi:peptide-methionine (S)-S-oxide reductase